MITDRFDTPHVYATTDADLVRVQGWLHARDRLWQMDITRRQVEGTLAEIVGQSALAGDVQARTVGLERAARRSLAALSEGDRGPEPQLPTDVPLRVKPC